MPVNRARSEPPQPAQAGFVASDLDFNPTGAGAGTVSSTRSGGTRWSNTGFQPLAASRSASIRPPVLLSTTPPTDNSCRANSRSIPARNLSAALHRPAPARPRATPICRAAPPRLYRPWSIVIRGPSSIVSPPATFRGNAIDTPETANENRDCPNTAPRINARIPRMLPKHETSLPKHNRCHPPPRITANRPGSPLSFRPLPSPAGNRSDMERNGSIGCHPVSRIPYLIPISRPSASGVLPASSCGSIFRIRPSPLDAEAISHPASIHGKMAQPANISYSHP